MRRLLLVAVGALALPSGLVCELRAQASSRASAPVSADAVRAAYLVNFIRFTEWPSGSQNDQPFTIGVVGNRDLEDFLIRNHEGKLLHEGRRIRIRRLNAPADSAGCQLIYVSPSPRRDASPFSSEDWIQVVSGSPVLTVGEEDGFLGKGGMINLYPENNNLRFEIAPDTAHKAGLQLSSRLLAIARIVRNPQRPGP